MFSAVGIAFLQVGEDVKCDATAFSKYGHGYAKPFLPLGNLLRTGYLVRADSVPDFCQLY
ncbi:hypothetical protein DBV39_10950 [Orrella marina]|uniref:Uncharacterized protein n=1 Tax=Orrella marina TaxID=2163011 RepID=A0A2R4XJZ4_9BURK|nr:hypothetical protein DBV39_10950 [Orrella marina]